MSCHVSGEADCARRLDQGLGLQPAVFEYFEGLHFADMGYLMNLMCFESNLDFIQNVGMVQIWYKNGRLTFCSRLMLSC